MSLPLPTFTITTPHDAFISQSGVEEMVLGLSDALQGTTYAATIKELKKHLETVQWWIDNMEDPEPVGGEDQDYDRPEHD